MDAKGITWVGNIYQKFETMCLEVEEIMYEDTVKYVENQVQTVGASVKRFYSDVMEDLLPPSSLDPEKASPCSYAVKQDSDDGVCRKPNASKKKKPVKVDVQELTEDGNDMDVHCNIDNLSKHSSADFVEAACSVCSRRDCDGRQYSSSNLRFKEDPNMERSPLTEISCPVSPFEKKLSRESSSNCEFLNENHEVSCNHTDTSPIQSVDGDTNCDSVAEISNMIESARHCTSSGDLLAESNAAEICMNNGTISTEGSSQNGEIQCDTCTDKNPVTDTESNFARWSSHWSFEASENNAIAEHGLETIQEIDKVKLEETCVVVNGNELSFLPQREDKRRTYKKKIREAFSSRMRSARKQEYEQLALQYGDDEKVNQEGGGALTQNLTFDEEAKKLQNDSCESEWELL